MHRWKDGRKEGQTDPILYNPSSRGREPNNLSSEMTGGNAPNLVLRRISRYFLKILPLKKTLQF